MDSFGEDGVNINES
jgi:hypothetical protein